MQQQLAQVGIKVQVQALEAGQRVERVESAQDPATAPVRMYYVGWSSSTGEADWALRPLLASESLPPKLFNTAYYKNAEVDADIAKALVTTDGADKAKLYTDAQQRIWKDAPWAFLVTEQLLVGARAQPGRLLRDPRRQLQLRRSRARSNPGRRSLLKQTPHDLLPPQAPAGPAADAAHRGGAGVPVRAHAARRSGAAGGRASMPGPETVELVRRTWGSTSRCRSSSCNFFSNIAAGRLRPRRMRSSGPVSTEIAERFMPTLLLTVTSMVWAVIFGMVHRHRLGGVPQPLARPAGHDAGGLGHLVSRLRAGHAADAVVLGAAGLAAHRRCRFVAALHPALAHAGRGGGGRDGALHALVLHRGDPGRLRAHGARQGRVARSGWCSSTACATR